YGGGLPTVSRWLVDKPLRHHDRCAPRPRTLHPDCGERCLWNLRGRPGAEPADRWYIGRPPGLPPGSSYRRISRRDRKYGDLVMADDPGSVSGSTRYWLGCWSGH